MMRHLGAHPSYSSPKRLIIFVTKICPLRPSLCDRSPLIGLLKQCVHHKTRQSVGSPSMPSWKLDSHEFGQEIRDTRTVLLGRIHHISPSPFSHCSVQLDILPASIIALLPSVFSHLPRFQVSGPCRHWLRPSSTNHSPFSRNSEPASREPSLPT
jgi:hypothetical protein